MDLSQFARGTPSSPVYYNGLDIIIKTDPSRVKTLSHRDVSTAIDTALESLYFPFGRDDTSVAAPNQEGDKEPLVDDIPDTVRAVDMAQNHFELKARDSIVVDDIDNESIRSYG